MIHDEQAECRSCGAEFWRGADERWKRLCLDCWREQKAAEDGKSRHDSSDCTRCYARGKADGMAQAVPAFDKARLRELLQLAHPDKHDGSPLAVRVTQWLNEQRRAGA